MHLGTLCQTVCMQPQIQRKSAPEDVIQRFNHELQISDNDLESMDFPTYPDWIDTMIAGITYWLCKCDSPKAPSGFHHIHPKTVAGRLALKEDLIQDWHDQWTTNEIHAALCCNVKGRPLRKKNLRHIADRLSNEKNLVRPKHESGQICHSPQD